MSRLGNSRWVALLVLLIMAGFAEGKSLKRWCSLFERSAGAPGNSEVEKVILPLLQRGKCRKALRKVKDFVDKRLKRLPHNRPCDQEKLDQGIAREIYRAHPGVIPGEMGFSLPPGLVGRIVGCLCRKGELDEALAFLRTQAMHRYDPLFVAWEGMLMVLKGEPQKALVLVDAVCRGSEWCTAARIMALEGLGRHDEASLLCNKLKYKEVCRDLERK